MQLRPHRLAVFAGLIAAACTPERPSAGSMPPVTMPAVARQAHSTSIPAVAANSARSELSDTNVPEAALATAEAPPPRELFPFQEPVPGSERVARSPATAAANLSPAQCRNELRRRNIETKRAPGPASGVATPLRLTAPVGGVRFVAPGGRSVYGTFDCRLVLALDDFSRILKQYSIVEVHIDNAYRPRARLPGRKRKRSQHAYGLAADVLGMRLEDGRMIVVERDWQRVLGEPSCGPEARPENPSEETVVLRNVLCQAAREGVFHHLLTPNYDEAHRDHLHLDIQRGARSLLLR